jgi:hypothetical protein
MRRVDLGEGLEDTTKDLANEVTLENIWSTIKVADGVFDVLAVCRAATKLSDSWNWCSSDSICFCMRDCSYISWLSYLVGKLVISN